MGIALGVVVVNYGSSSLLEKNLVATANGAREALASAGRVEVFVVDNASTATERTTVRGLCDANGWRLLPIEGNAGFGGGVNAGAAAAFETGATDLLVINPDATIDAASIRVLAAAAQQHPLTLLAPVVRTPTGRVWFDGADLYLRDGATRSHRRRDAFAAQLAVPWLSGACLWVSAAVWACSGGFDEEYFLYWEDVDFSQRVADAGGSLAVVADASAVHDEGGTHRDTAQRSEAKSPTYYTYNIRNRMLFAARHLDVDGIKRWQRTGLAAALEVLLRGGRRQFLHPVRPVRAAWTGWRAGNSIARAEIARRKRQGRTR